MQQVSQFFAFCGHVILVVLVSADFEWHTVYDLKAERFNAHDLFGIVCHQPDAAQPQIRKDLRADTILSKVGFETERVVCFYGIESLVLFFVGEELVLQPYAASFLVQVNNRAGALLRDLFHGGAQLWTAIASK